MIIKEKLYRISFIFFLGISVLFTRAYSQDIKVASERSVIDSLFAVADCIFPPADSNYVAPFDPFHIDLPDTLILSTEGLPLIFWGADFSYMKMNIPSMFPEKPWTKPIFSEPHLFADRSNRGKYSRMVYDYITQNHPELFDYTMMQIPNKVEKLEMMSSNIFQHLFTLDFDVDAEKSNRPQRNAPKRRYWVYHGTDNIKLSQNYLSDNWYKGGSGNLNLVNNHNITITYNKDKVTFSNFWEWKLSLFNSPNDTLRNFRIGEDLIRTYSTFGLKASKYWSYSINMELKTQIFKNYKENTTQSVSSFMSPFMANIGLLGMNYQLKKTYPKVRGKNLDFSADIAPLSMQYTYVKDEEIDPQRFGIEEGKSYKLDIGSTINAKLLMYFNKNVNLTSRFKYFTSYKMVQVESENTLNMPINRYFSTTIYIYLRYDDSAGVKTDPKLGYFQLSEMLSFGFNFTW
ncbi:MAG: DUF3078 domain-containing protein [Dysgonamonadaceae bacterium]|jgi:hypothetical protein|nr:DUF3078 domain-containing protein [Dysgonamonadaceae bacterium]